MHKGLGDTKLALASRIGMGVLGGQALVFTAETFI